MKKYVNIGSKSIAFDPDLITSIVAYEFLGGMSLEIGMSDPIELSLGDITEDEAIAIKDRFVDFVVSDEMVFDLSAAIEDVLMKKKRESADLIKAIGSQWSSES